MTDFSTTPISELAAIIAEHLQQHGIEVVLVGGLAVEIYTENLYLTLDIDIVNTNYQPAGKIHGAMAILGFYKQGRVYVNNTTRISVEFPPGPLSVGDQLIKKIARQQVGNKFISILTVTDVVKDRLAAYIHWQDRQSLIQATAIMIKHQLIPAAFASFCEHEGAMDKFRFLEALYKRATDQSVSNMADLESLLTQQLLNDL